MSSTKFLNVISSLTVSGKAVWWRQKEHPQHLWCFVNDEIIIFDTHNEEGQVERDAGGFSAKARNLHFVWLTDLHGWNEIVDLLQLALSRLANDDFYTNHITACYEKLDRDLEMLEDAT